MALSQLRTDLATWRISSLGTRPIISLREELSRREKENAASDSFYLIQEAVKQRYAFELLKTLRLEFPKHTKSVFDLTLGNTVFSAADFRQILGKYQIEKPPVLIIIDSDLRQNCVELAAVMKPPGTKSWGFHAWRYRGEKLVCVWIPSDFGRNDLVFGERVSPVPKKRLRGKLSLFWYLLAQALFQISQWESPRKAKNFMRKLGLRPEHDPEYDAVQWVGLLRDR